MNKSKKAWMAGKFLHLRDKIFPLYAAVFTTVAFGPVMRVVRQESAARLE